MDLYTKAVTDLINGKHPLDAFLINGVRLQGIITKADDTGLFICREGKVQFVRSDALATLMPTETPANWQGIEPARGDYGHAD